MLRVILFFAALLLSLSLLPWLSNPSWLLRVCGCVGIFVAGLGVAMSLEDR